MAIAFDNSSGANKGTVIPRGTVSHTINDTTNGLLILGVAWGGATTAIGTVTYAGASPTGTIGTVNTTNATNVAAYYVKSPPTGANDFVVVFSANVRSLNMGAISLTGVNQDTPIAGSTTGTGSGTNISNNLNTLNDNAWMIDVTTAAQNSTGSINFTPTAGQIETMDVGAFQTQFYEGGMTYKGPITPPASTTMQETVTGTNQTIIWAHIQFEIVPFASFLGYKTLLGVGR